MNAIVLAGGFGTRLRSVVQDVPKPMAPIAGKPFLEHLLQQAMGYGVRHFVLATGYKSELIEQHFGKIYHHATLAYSVEDEPLGTGGAIWKAMQTLSPDEPVFVLNGDTMFKADLNLMREAYFKYAADMVVALKPMRDFDRYGTVNIDNQGRIQAFEEKSYRPYGLINGGIYYLRPDAIAPYIESAKFSFEQAILESHTQHLQMQGYVEDAYFIDIGIPEDYALANVELL